MSLEDVWRERYIQACRAFQNREFSEAVFKKKLSALGFRPNEIEREVWMNFPPTKEEPRKHAYS